MSDPFGNISIQPGAPRPSNSGPEAGDQTARSHPPGAPAPPPTTPQRHRRQKSRTETWLLVLVFVVISGCAAGFFLTPYLLQKGIGNLLRQTTGLEMTTGQLTFNPFTFQLAATNLNLRHALPEAEAHPPVHIEQLYIRLNPRALQHGQINFNEILISQPSFDLKQQASGQLDLQLRPLSTPPVWLMATQKLGLQFTINDLRIENGSIRLHDQAGQQTHIIDQIDLTLPGMALGNRQPAGQVVSIPRFQARINNSPFSLEGAVDHNEQGQPQVSLSCDLTDLDLPLYLGSLDLPLQLNKGRGDTHLSIAYNPQDQDTGRLRLNYRTTITEAELSSPDKAFQLTAPDMLIQGSWQPLARRHQLQQWQISTPRIQAGAEALKQQLSTLLPLLNLSATGNTESPLFSLSDGYLTILSSSPENKLQTWLRLQLSINNSPAQTTFTLNGRRDDTHSLFQWQGTLVDERLLGPLTIKGLSASDLLPFLSPDPQGQAAGQGTLQGTLELDLKPNHPWQPSFSQGQLEIQDLRLTHNHREWLQAGQVSLEGVTRGKGHLDLGTIRITDSEVNLFPGQWPPLLNKQDGWSFQKLDLKGQLTLNPQEKTGSPLTLDDLHLTYQPRTGQTGTDSTSLLTATINGQSGQDVPGRVEINTLRSPTGDPLLDFKASKIPATVLGPWLPAVPLIRNATALVNCTGWFNPKNSLFTGHLELEAGQVAVGQPAVRIGWERATFQDLVYNLKEQSVRIGRLDLDRLNGRWLRQPANPSSTASPSLATAAAALLQQLFQDPSVRQAATTIDQFHIQQGTIDYQDLRLNPPWQTQISGISGSISDLSRNSHSAFHFDGQIGESPLELKGSSALFSDGSAEEWTLTLSRLPLASFQEQIARPLALDGRQAHVDLELSQKLDIDHPEPQATLTFTGLRPATGQTTSRLTLALLKDPREQFSDTLPMAPDAGPLARQWASHFRSLTLKAQVAPLLLSGPFKHLAEVNGLEMAAGRTQITASARILAQDLAFLLDNRPGLGLLLTGLADPLVDHKVLLAEAEAREQERVTLENQRRLLLWQEAEAARQKVQLAPLSQSSPKANEKGPIQEQNISAAELIALTPISPQPVRVDDDLLLDLAKERAFLVYDLLTSDFGINSSRLRLEQGRLNSAPPGNRVLFTATTLN